MNNVIGMFFKDDESAAGNQEAVNETLVGSEPEPVASGVEAESVAAADTTEATDSEQSDNVGDPLATAAGPEDTQSSGDAADVVGRVGPFLLVAEDVEEKGDAPLSLSGDGQFSLFGDNDFVTPGSEADNEADSCGDAKKLNTGKSSTSVKGKKAAAAGTGTTTIPAPAPKRKKDQNLEVDDTWTIHYATESFRVTDFVNPFPVSGKVNLEQLREEMEKEFHEMTKARTTWDYDEDLKRLYPDVNGTDKGCR